MGMMTRYCRECDRDQLFDQPHDGQGCPDVPDGECPEWACTWCGSALFTGFPSVLAEPDDVREWPSRVA